MFLSSTKTWNTIFVFSVETINVEDSDSEEDAVVILNADKKTNKKRKKIK